MTGFAKNVSWVQHAVFHACLLVINGELVCSLSALSPLHTKTVPLDACLPPPCQNL